ncbi:MAG: hypothetical protein Q8P67_28450 [archaeon]|nr:hypothetical protein [archaeon]
MWLSFPIIPPAIRASAVRFLKAISSVAQTLSSNQLLFCHQKE